MYAFETFNIKQKHWSLDLKQQPVNQLEEQQPIRSEWWWSVTRRQSCLSESSRKPNWVVSPLDRFLYPCFLDVQIVHICINKTNHNTFQSCILHSPFLITCKHSSCKNLSALIKSSITFSYKTSINIEYQLVSLSIGYILWYTY